MNTNEQLYPKYRFAMIPLCLLGGCMAMFLTYLVSPIMGTLQEDLNTTSTVIGYASTVASAFMGAFMFFAVIIIGKLNVKKTYMLVFVLYIISCLICANAQSGLMFIIGRAFLGCGWGLSGGVFASAVFMFFPGKERPAIFTCNMVGTSLLTMSAFTIIVPMVNVMGWRKVYWILFGINVVVFLLWLFVGKDYDANATSGIQIDKTAKKGSLLDGYKIAFRNKEIWILAVIMIFYVLGTSCLNFFFPSFLQNVRGLEAGASGTVTGVRSLASLIGSLVGGSVAIALGRRKPIVNIATLGILVSFLLLFNVKGVVPLTVVMFANGVMNFMNPAIQTAAQEVPGTTPESASAANAMLYGIGTFLGLFLPTILGTLEKSVGLSSAMSITCVGVALISWIASFFMVDRGPKAKIRK